MAGGGLLIIFFSILSINLYSKSYFEKVGARKKRIGIRTKGCVSIIGVALEGVLMLVCFYTVPNRSYNIANIQEFNILANMPFAGKCNYVLLLDLDFNGKSSKGWDGIKYFYGTFDGNGHTICNLKYVGNARKTNQYETSAAPSSSLKYYSDGFVGVNYGTIKNINLKECVFKIEYANPQNVEDAFLGIISGENGGTIENCSLTNCFLEHNLKGSRGPSSDHMFHLFVGADYAYGEGSHYFLNNASYEGKLINNSINNWKDYLVDDGYILVNYQE